MLAVCRSAVQLLVNLASLDGGFVRRVLGCTELRMRTFHLAHLVLQHHLECDAAASRPSSRAALLPPGVEAELTPLLHETLLLLGRRARRSRCVRVMTYSRFIFVYQPSALTPHTCLLYTSPSPRDGLLSRMPSSA